MTGLRGMCLSALTVLLAGCEGRDSAPAPSTGWLAEPLSAVQTSAITAGTSSAPPEITNPYTDDPAQLELWGSALLPRLKALEVKRPAVARGAS